MSQSGENDRVKFQGLVEILKSWPEVDIDPEGLFKYVLIEATAYVEGFPEESRLLVRGFNWAEYHADIYDREEEKLRKSGLDAQCLGGGRIRRNSKEVLVYGYSVGFGRADHSKTCDVIKRQVGSEIKVHWNNEGY